MEKNNINSQRVDFQALSRFVRTQFAEFHPPPLEEFLAIKRSGPSEVRPFTFSADPHGQLAKDAGEILEGEAVLYVQSGCVELLRKEGKQWQREFEYKEGSFFTLLNYRSVASPEPEWYKLVFKTKAVISVLPLRSNYGYEWMRATWHKNALLAKVFCHNDPEAEIERKKQRFHDFIGRLKLESFRRDTKIVTEGSKNEKLYIIARGEARLIKQLVAGEISKPVDILYLREGAVFGAQLFLIGSKPIHTIISNHTDSRTTAPTSSKLSIRQEEHQQSELEQADNARPKRKARSRFSKIAVESGGYELYDPHENVSNYTVRAESANLQLFYVQLDGLVGAISERYKINFLRLLEATYITILRRTHEKMSLELKKEQERIRSNASKVEAIASKAYSSHDQHSEVITSSQHLGISLKITEIGRGKDTINQFKNQEVRKAQSHHFDRRTELLTREKKPVVDFKEKIEALIESKLNRHKEEGSTGQLVDDLTDIFMKKNEGRSEDIEKRADYLERKKAILDKRGGWKPGWDQLKEEGVTVVKKKAVQTPNYLTGLRMEDYATGVMERCNHKIHETNKIKEQFMKIKSECPSCSCYDNFENFSTGRRSLTCLGRTGTKTAEGWGKTSKVRMEQESLETVYHRMTFLSEKAKEKYNHNIHLLQVRRNRTQLERRRSAPRLT